MGVGLSNRTLHYYLLVKRLYTSEEVVRRKQNQTCTLSYSNQPQKTYKQKQPAELFCYLPVGILPFHTTTCLYLSYLSYLTYTPKHNPAPTKNQHSLPKKHLYI